MKTSPIYAVEVAFCFSQIGKTRKKHENKEKIRGFETGPYSDLLCSISLRSF
jgi:hypothetical protein